MDRIEPDMKVADVVDRHPETVEVFLRHECPDMRKGLFRVMSHIMSIRWAAWVHGIPLGQLVRELNNAVDEADSTASRGEFSR